MALAITLANPGSNAMITLSSGDRGALYVVPKAAVGAAVQALVDEYARAD
jgi:hypothetical protein